MANNDQVITIQAYQAKCEFCGEKFIELKPHIAEEKRNQHMYNDCPVLRCIAIAKDMEYPIDIEGPNCAGGRE